MYGRSVFFACFESNHEPNQYISPYSLATIVNRRACWRTACLVRYYSLPPPTPSSAVTNATNGHQSSHHSVQTPPRSNIDKLISSVRTTSEYTVCMVCDKGHPPRACRAYLHDKWGVGRYYLGASRERYYVGLCSRIDGLVSPMSDILDSKLHPGLIF